MLCSRRPLRGLLLAAFVLMLCHSTKAQQAFRPGRDSEVPAHFVDDLPGTLACGSAGENGLSLALSATRLGLPGCDAPVAEARGALAKTPAPGSVRSTAASSPEIRGKKGQSILAARSRALDVLGTGNECSEWCRHADRDPAH